MCPFQQPAKTAASNNGPKRATQNDINVPETPPSPGPQEKFYLLKQEQALLLAQIRKAKKEIFDSRNKQTALEFRALQEPQQYTNSSFFVT